MLTEAQKAALAKGRTPEARARQAESLRKTMATKKGREHQAKMLAAVTPEVMEKRAGTLRKTCQTPEGRERMSAMARARWDKKGV